MNRCWSGWLLAGVLAVGSARGDVKPAWIFQDNMVLQHLPHKKLQNVVLMLKEQEIICLLDLIDTK